MEELLGGMSRYGTTIASDPSMRMPSRPPMPGSSSQPKGRNYEDLGSDFGKPSGQKGYKGLSSQESAPRSSQSKRSAAYKAPRPDIPATLTDWDDDPLLLVVDGSDELDTLSQSSPHGSRSRSPVKPNRNGKSKKGPLESDQDVVFIKGGFHEVPQEYKAKKLPSFKKNKGASADAKKAKEVSDRISLDDSQDSLVTQAGPNAALPTDTFASGRLATIPSNSNPGAAPSSSRNMLEPSSSRLTQETAKNTSKKAQRTTNPKPKGGFVNKPFKPPSRVDAIPAMEVAASGEEQTPRPKPKPKPLNKGTNAAQASQEFPTLSPLASQEKDGGGDGPKEKAKAKAMVCPLDILSPVAKDKAVNKGKGKEKENGRGEPPKRKVQDFPMAHLTPPKDRHVVFTNTKDNPIAGLSPLSSEKTAGRPVRTKPLSGSGSLTFPTISPLSSPATGRIHQDNPTSSAAPNKAKLKVGSQSRAKLRKVGGRTRICSSSEGTGSSDDEDEPVPIARPFPMATQMLESIGHAGSKRIPDQDDSERSKKRIKGADEMLAELLHSEDASIINEDDLRFLNPDIDPRTLCPWCDEPLPPVPSPHLSSLIKQARSRSYADSRPTNPLGLWAEPTVFVGVCQRHSFESIQVPLAVANGWPTSIEWEHVAERVRRFKARLQAIVDDFDEDFQPGKSWKLGDDEEEDDILYDHRPRKGSIFWKDVVKNIKKQGSRRTAGVRGQFSSFQKTQPGYYGELGYVIIHQTIYDLFPLASFNSDSILPLAPTEFIPLILVPEAAVSLIMEDMDLARPDAISTLRASAEYGVAMFPDDHAEGTSAVLAGEQIVRERARVRRKELQAEEKDDELWEARESESERPLKRKGGGKQKSAALHPVSDSGESTRSTRSARKANGTRKKASPSDGSDVQMLSDRSDSPARRSKKSNKTRSGSQTATMCGSAKGCDVEMRLCGSTDSLELSDIKARARPKSRSKTPSAGGKENTITSDADSDVQEIAGPSAANGAKRGRKRAHKAQDDIDVDATPKPRKTLSRTASASSTGAVLGASGSDSLFPLNIMHTRQLRSQDGWSFNLRQNPVEDESSALSDASAVSTASRPRRRKKHVQSPEV